MKWALALIPFALLFPLSPALAQDENDVRVRVGLGVQSRPEFLGADENGWAPLWDVAIKRGTDPFDFEAPDDSFDIKLFTRGGFSLGPSANVQNGRKRSEVDAPIGKVSTTFEAGIFAQYEVNDSIRLRGELRKGLGGHEGTAASLGGDYYWRDGDRYLFSIGPRLLLSDARYQRAWFGVNAETSADLALAQYRPGGGLYALAGTSGMTYQFSRDFGLFGFVRYERLIGDAARSPIVREFGSRNQVSGGLGLTYSFTIKR
jgi:outer membrane protein